MNVHEPLSELPLTVEREHERPGGRHGHTPAPDLATRQRELVAALVAGAPVPSGLDPARFAAAERALRGKRAGEVAQVWPLLASALNASAQRRTSLGETAPDETFLGETFGTLFARWATARPSHGALRDGWDFARELAAADRLPELARLELAGRDVRIRYDGHHEPRPRRLPTVRRVAEGWLVGLPGLDAHLVRRPSGVHRRHTG